GHRSCRIGFRNHKSGTHPEFMYFRIRGASRNYDPQKISFSASWITRGCESVALPVAEIWPNAPAVRVVFGFRNKARFGMLNISARNSNLRRSSMLVILATLTSTFVRVGPRNAF